MRENTSYLALYFHKGTRIESLRNIETAKYIENTAKKKNGTRFVGRYVGIDILTGIFWGKKVSCILL